MSGAFIFGSIPSEEEKIEKAPEPQVESNVDSSEVRVLSENKEDEIEKPITKNNMDSEIQNQVSETIEQVEQPIAEKKWWGQSLFANKRERFGFIAYILPIVIMSLASTISLINFFSLGHPGVLSYMLGFAFETASLATIVMLVVSKKLDKRALWGVLSLLFILQVLGNTLEPYANLADSTNPHVAYLYELLGLSRELISDRRIVAVIQGLPLPLISMLMFKLTSNQFRSEEENS